MNSKSLLRAFLAAIVMGPAFTACRKELCFNHFRTAAGALEGEYEWERDYGAGHAAGWDADFHGFGYDALRPERPEGVTLLTYALGGTEPSTSFLPVEGADVNLGEGGEHSLLFFNNDTEYIVISDIASLPEARATTTSRSRSSLGLIKEKHPDERTINPPDVLFGSFVGKLPEIGLHESAPLPVRMQPLVYTYVVHYEFEHGLEHVALVRGALAGMAEAVYLRDGVTSEEQATILYDCEFAGYGAVAKVRSFGVPGFPDEYYGRSAESRASRVYTLNLEVRLTNGAFKEFTFDVSDQMAGQPRGGVITVSGIRVEDNENLGDSGFDVTVDGWGEHVDIDLPVGNQK